MLHAVGADSVDDEPVGARDGAPPTRCGVAYRRLLLRLAARDLDRLASRSTTWPPSWPTSPARTLEAALAIARAEVGPRTPTRAGSR